MTWRSQVGSLASEGWILSGGTRGMAVVAADAEGAAWVEAPSVGLSQQLVISGWSVGVRQRCEVLTG